jgi:four helix bundle protein
VSPTVRSYRDLVWQKAVELAVICHQAAKRLPKEEMYGLSLQIRRSSVSVSANIAEGHGRDHLGDYLHHLSIANGSLMELETLLVIASRLAYLKSAETESILVQTGEISRMLSGLTSKLKTRQSQGSRP